MREVTLIERKIQISGFNISISNYTELYFHFVAGDRS